MTGKELESFILKFNQLWRAGHSAKLDVETHAGQAWVGLRVQLGQAHPQQVHLHKNKTRNSPARERRRARRLAERQTDKTEEVIENLDAEQAVQSESVAENAADCERVEANAPAEKVFESIEKESEAERAQDLSISDSVAVDNCEQTQLVIVEDELCSNDIYDKEVGTEKEELVVVYATAQFENSPYTDLTQDDVLSLERFICSEDHLTRNIANIEIDLKVNLEAEVRLHVRRKNLWESPKSYIWKFLGGDNHWARQNGTKIRMRRIHVK